MKYIYYVFLFFFLTSCSTLDVTQLTSNKTESLDPIEMKPDYDFLELRFDILRQTTTDSDGDTEDESYSNLGMNLGNGLYFDYRANLALRIDYLFNLTMEDDFVIKHYFNPDHSERHYTYEYKDKHLRVKGTSAYSKFRERCFYEIHSDTIIKRKSRRVLSELILNDEGIREIDGWLSNYKIVKSGKNSYTKNSKKKKPYFNREGNTLELGGCYRYLPLNDSIYRYQGCGILDKRFDIYHVRKNEHGIFIYRPEKYFGYRVVKNGNVVDIYLNDELCDRYTCEKLN